MAAVSFIQFEATQNDPEICLITLCTEHHNLCTEIVNKAHGKQLTTHIQKM